MVIDNDKIKLQWLRDFNVFLMVSFSISFVSMFSYATYMFRRGSENKIPDKRHVKLRKLVQ